MAQADIFKLRSVGRHKKEIEEVFQTIYGDEISYEGLFDLKNGVLICPSNIMVWFEQPVNITDIGVLLLNGPDGWWEVSLFDREQNIGANLTSYIGDGS